MNVTCRSAAADVPIHEQLATALGALRGTEAADRLCEACVDLFHVDAAAISLIFDGTNSGTLGASSPPARLYDELQFTLGEGPCLDSVAHRAPVLVSDLADVADVRWPAYAPAMLAHQICSVFAMPVVLAGEYVGALDLYRNRSSSLGPDELAGALVAAELAQMPLLDLLAEDLKMAVDNPGGDTWTELHRLTRVEVSQATGMLIAQLEVDAAEALVRLRAYAYATNRSATDVARDILDNGLLLEIDE
jgi:GAF domain/ANTAR domain